MANERLARLYRTREIEKGFYITEITDEPNLDSLEFCSYRFRIKDVLFDDREGALVFSLENKDLSEKYPYAIHGVSEIKSFLENMQVLKNPNHFWKDIPRLKGIILEAIFHYDSRGFYGLGVPTRKYELIGCETQAKQIKETKEELIRKKACGELTESDYVFVNELRRDRLIGEKNLMTKKAIDLAIDDVKMDDVFDGTFWNEE